MQSAIKNANADGMINVEVTFSEFNFFLLSFPMVEVEGDLVKMRGQVSSATATSDVTFLESPSDKKSEVKNIPIDTGDVESWKKDILSNKDFELKRKWKSFARRNSINISWEEWVGSLSSAEYMNYLESKLAVRKWIGKRLEKEGANAEIIPSIPQSKKSEFIGEWKLFSSKLPDGKILGPKSGLSGNLVLTENQKVKLVFNKIEFNGKYFLDQAESMTFEVEQIDVPEPRTKIYYKNVQIQDGQLILRTESG